MAARQKAKLSEEIAAIKKAYTNTLVKRVMWDDAERSLNLRLEAGGNTFRFNFYIPDDFPAARPFCSIDGDETEEITGVLVAVNEVCELSSSTITAIVKCLVDQLCKVAKVDPPVVAEPAASAEDPPTKTRLFLPKSSGDAWKKQSVDGTTADSDEEGFGDVDDALGVGTISETTMLSRHCDQVRRIYGDNALEVHALVDNVRFFIDTSGLDADSKAKLGVGPVHQQVTLSLQFGTGDYTRHTRVPTVKVVHPEVQISGADGSKVEVVRSGLGDQLESIARQYLDKYWPTLFCPLEEVPVNKLVALGYERSHALTALEHNGHNVERAAAWLANKKNRETLTQSEKKALRGSSGFRSAKTAPPSATIPATSTEAPPANEKKKKGFFSSIFGSKKKSAPSAPGTGTTTTNTTPATTTATPTTTDPHDSSGPTAAQANPPSPPSPLPEAVVELMPRRKDPVVVPIKELLKHGQRQLAIATALHLSNFEVAAAIDLLKDLNVHFPEEDALLASAKEQTTAKERNFVLELFTYLVRRVPDTMGHCLICDAPLLHEDIRTPTICTLGTCQFNYIELGVCSSIPVTICPSSIAADIDNNPDVVDLYISMAVAAVTSSRRNLIFTPFPPEFETMGIKHYDKVKAVLDLLPSVEDMQKHCANEASLITYLGKFDQSGASYRLLRWILTTKRAALLKMPPNLQIKEMNTPHQYLLMAETDPQKQANFKKWRKEYGSYFAFHGSGIENWHSILRNGLLNCSGTALMTTGAVYGSGIYLAPDSSTSMGYARTGAAWAKSRFGDSSSLVCMAIAEVCKCPDVPTTPNPYYVVKNVDAVTTRFFCFYPGGLSPGSVQSSSLQLHKYVQ